MHERNKRITFMHSFTLSGVEDVLPSGTYSVETREERAGLFWFLKSRHTSTWIQICRTPGIGGFLLTVNVDPQELKAALVTDTMTGFDRRSDRVAPAPRSSPDLLKTAASTVENWL
jgi:hypothetical protein